MKSLGTIKECPQKAELEITNLKEQIKSFEKSNDKNECVIDRTKILEDDINKLKSEKDRNSKDLKEIELKLKSIVEEQKVLKEGKKKHSDTTYIRSVDTKTENNQCKKSQEHIRTKKIETDQLKCKMCSEVFHEK